MLVRTDLGNAGTMRLATRDEIVRRTAASVHSIGIQNHAPDARSASYCGEGALYHVMSSAPAAYTSAQAAGPSSGSCKPVSPCKISKRISGFKAKALR